jgi:DNA-binding protein H-NS
MAERAGEKITEWLEIDLGKLTGAEGTELILEIMENLNTSELRIIRDSAEKQRQAKLKDAKTSVIAEMRKRLAEVDLTFEEVAAMEGNKKTRKAASLKAKYNSPDGLNTWSGRGRVPVWLRDLEAQGHSRDAFLIRDE